MGREPVTAHQQQNSAVREDSGIFFSVCRKDHGPAMLKNAPIFLDEATANVAPENGKKLMDAIEALTREKTVITRARRRKTVRCAGRIPAPDGICRRFIAERRRAGGWKI